VDERDRFGDLRISKQREDLGLYRAWPAVPQVNCGASVLRRQRRLPPPQRRQRGSRGRAAIASEEMMAMTIKVRGWLEVRLPGTL